MKKRVIGIGAVVILVVGMLFAYSSFSEKPVEGSKAVTIEVINSKGESTMYEAKTDAAYLDELFLEVEGLKVEGKEDKYGLLVDTVNGEFAEFNTNGAYWGFSVNGEYCNYGVSEQPVEDGDAFQIIYTLG